MKKQQQNLSPYELVAKEIVKKNADNKKLKKENFHNEISYRFKNLVEAILKAELSQYLAYEKSRSKNADPMRVFVTVLYCIYPIESLLRTNSSVKRNKNLVNIEEPVFSLFASGMSYENIANTIKNIYKKEISNGWISPITDKLLPEIEKWKSQKSWQFLSNFVHWWDVF